MCSQGWIHGILAGEPDGRFQLARPRSPVAASGPGSRSVHASAAIKPTTPNQGLACRGGKGLLADGQCGFFVTPAGSHLPGDVS